jgi:hypothetical protein
MGFKYIDTLATPDNVDKLLTLVDKVAGVGVETNWVSFLSRPDNGVGTVALCYRRHSPVQSNYEEECRCAFVSRLLRAIDCN